MELQDIRPKQSSFYLRLIGETCTLNPISLDHELRFMEKYGKDWINAIISEDSISDIIWVVYQLLTTESQAYFIKRDIISYDDEGNEKKTTIGGTALFKRMISGAAESESMVKALVENIGISRPDPVDDKKKVENLSGD
ncbi:MAG: hypothetical protein ACTSRU_19155 [Candidatus Hodarchaeales archaeon]